MKIKLKNKPLVFTNMKHYMWKRLLKVKRKLTTIWL